MAPARLGLQGTGVSPMLNVQMTSDANDQIVSVPTSKTIHFAVAKTGDACSQHVQPNQLVMFGAKLQVMPKA